MANPGTSENRSVGAESAPNLKIQTIDPSLYNADLAPIAHRARSWGWFEIFNVWSNVVQSVFGYTLAASLFITYGLNGWAVFAGIVLAGVIIMLLVNLSGKPSVKYGIPYPVMARAGMGVRGANLPAMVRGIVAMFWYGAQTYFASTAIALLIISFLGTGVTSGGTFLGMTPVGWSSFVIAWAFQMFLFWKGIEWIRFYLNWAAPAIYAVMIVLMLMLWVHAGPGLLTQLGDIFEGQGSHGGHPGGPVAAFMAVVGTMIALYGPIILNYGDFTRYVRHESDMKLGNLLGLPLNVAFFAFIALYITAGAAVVFGERLTNPTEIIRRVDNLALTVVASLTFFAATVGINVVANFVPPANDLSNLLPRRISFRKGGLIAASVAFVVGGLWVSVISNFGLGHFVNTLGAVLAPAYGIMIADYYLVKKADLDIQQLYSSDPNGAYYYWRGWNQRAIVAFAVAASFSMLAVWLPALSFLAGFDWLLGALFAGVIYWLSMRPARR
ncbi:MAG: NCS1 family nucleobase:cation symporter-1 [Alphaproteobacteria bacterium]|nr:NCS1 family nucleobase:cation symporter-1 [Alphaproteobacteria bacterium]